MDLSVVTWSGTRCCSERAIDWELLEVGKFFWLIVHVSMDLILHHLGFRRKQFLVSNPRTSWYICFNRIDQQTWSYHHFCIIIIIIPWLHHHYSFYEINKPVLQRFGRVRRWWASTPLWTWTPWVPAMSLGTMPWPGAKLPMMSRIVDAYRAWLDWMRFDLATSVGIVFPKKMEKCFQRLVFHGLFIIFRGFPTFRHPFGNDYWSWITFAFI